MSIGLAQANSMVFLPYWIWFRALFNSDAVASRPRTFSNARIIFSLMWIWKGLIPGFTQTLFLRNCSQRMFSAVSRHTSCAIRMFLFCMSNQIRLVRNRFKYMSNIVRLLYSDDDFLNPKSIAKGFTSSLPISLSMLNRDFPISFGINLYSYDLRFQVSNQPSNPLGNSIPAGSPAEFGIFVNYFRVPWYWSPFPAYPSRHHFLQVHTIIL